MRYEDAVAEGRQLVKRSEEDQWRLAELTWEQCQDRSRSRAQWARDIGISERHARALYQVWDTYSGQWNRPGEPIPFTDAYATTKGYPSDPTERAEAQAVTRVHNMPIARKAEVARELLSEPEVADQVAPGFLRDSAVRAQQRRDIFNGDLDAIARGGRVSSLDEINADAKPGPIEDVAEAVGAIDRAIANLWTATDAVAQLSPFPADSRHAQDLRDIAVKLVDLIQHEVTV